MSEENLSVSVHADDTFVYIDLDESVCWDLDDRRLAIPLQQASEVMLKLAALLKRSPHHESPL